MQANLNKLDIFLLLGGGASPLLVGDKYLFLLR